MGSTINPAVPVQGGALATAPLRSQFAAAIADIDGLMSEFAGPTPPANPMEGQRWLNTGASPHVRNYFDGAAWIVTDLVDPVGHTVTPQISPIATGSLVGRSLPTRFAETIDVADFNASGSEQSTTGLITRGTSALILSAAIDFADGQGVLVVGAGAGCGATAPSGLSVSVVGAAGSTSYAYAISADDGNGGVTAALSPVSVATGNATLTGADRNHLAWTQGTGNAATHVWVSENSGPYAYCGVTFGTTFEDIGLRPTPRFYVPATPPGTPQNQFFTSTIVAGAGSQTLTLAGQAPNNGAGIVLHDDTLAIQAAVASAESRTGSFTAGNPDIDFGTFFLPVPIVFAAGAHYCVSGQINLGASHALMSPGLAHIAMAGYGTIFAGAAIDDLLVDGLVVQGGGAQFSLANADVNQCLFRFRRCGFWDSADYPLKTVGAYSSQIECDSCIANNTNGFVAADCDLIVVRGGWWQPGMGTFGAGRNWVNQTHGTTYFYQATKISDVTGVPGQFSGSTPFENGNAWFGVNGALSVRGFRGGGEGGGIPLVAVNSTLQTGPYWQGATIDIEDSAAYAEPPGDLDGAIILNGIPQSIKWQGNVGPLGAPIVALGSGFNWSTALAAWKTASGISDETPYIDVLIDPAGWRGTLPLSGNAWPSVLNNVVHNPGALGNAMAAGQILIGQGNSTQATIETIAGDATLAANGTLSITKPLAVPGAASNLAASNPTAGATITVAADAVVAATALNGTAYLLTGFSEAFNGAGTGAGGMDTGSIPTSGFLALYAIYDPAGPTVSILGVNASSAAAPTIYGGAHLPSGYTASALLAVLATNSSGQIAANQYVLGRKVVFPAVTACQFSGSNASPTSLSLSGVVPANAKTVSGNLALNMSGTGITAGICYVIVGSDGALAGKQLVSGYLSGTGQNDDGNFNDLPMPTPQTIYYQNVFPTGSTSSSVIQVNGYSI